MCRTSVRGEHRRRSRFRRKGRRMSYLSARQGALGYLSLAGLPGNLALWDQREALTWLERNVARWVERLAHILAEYRTS